MQTLMGVVDQIVSGKRRKRWGSQGRVTGIHVRTRVFGRGGKIDNLLSNQSRSNSQSREIAREQWITGRSIAYGVVPIPIALAFISSPNAIVSALAILHALEA